MLDEWAGDLAEVERNLLGVALRPEVETRLVPWLLTVDALLLEADAETLRRLLEGLELVQTPLLADAEFLSEMAGSLDPVGYEVLSENSGPSPGESLSASGIQGVPVGDGSLRPRAVCSVM